MLSASPRRSCEFHSSWSPHALCGPGEGNVDRGDEGLTPPSKSAGFGSPAYGLTARSRSAPARPSPDQPTPAPLIEVGLAVQLGALGAEVRVCAPPGFAELLATVGVPPVPNGQPVRPPVTGATPPSEAP